MDGISVRGTGGNCISLFSGPVNDKKVSIFCHPDGKIKGTIFPQRTPCDPHITGIPKKIVNTSPENIARIRKLFRGTYRIFSPSDYEIQVMGRLKAGEDYGSWGILEDENSGLQDISNLALLATMAPFVVGGPVTTALGVGGILVLFVQSMMSDMEAQKYRRLVDDMRVQIDQIQASTRDQEEKNKEIWKKYRELESTIRQQLSEDRNFQQVSQEELAEVLKAHVPSLPERATAEQYREYEQNLHIFFQAASFLWSFKNKEQGEKLYQTGPLLVSIIVAGKQIAAGVAVGAGVASYALPAATILTAGLKLFAIWKGKKPDPLSEKVLQSNAEFLKEAQQEQRCQRIERLLGEAYAGITNELKRLDSRIDQLGSNTNRVLTQMNAIYNLVDTKMRGLINNILFTWTINTCLRGSPGVTKEQNFQSLADISTWADGTSKEDILIGLDKDLSDVSLLVTGEEKVPLENIYFHIGLIEKYLQSDEVRDEQSSASFAVANPVIWSSATSAFLMLWRKRKDQQSHYQAYFEENVLTSMIDTGKELQRFTKCIQGSKALFSLLITKYKDAVQAVKIYGEREELTDIGMQDKTTELNKRYFLLMACVEYGFTTSRERDPFFRSLLLDVGDLPFRLRTPKEVTHCITQFRSNGRIANNRYREFWSDLSTTTELLKSSIGEKIDSYQAETHAEHFSLVSLVLHEFHLFLGDFYPDQVEQCASQNDSRTFFSVNPNDLAGNNLFIAIKLGLVEEVEARITADSSSIDEQDPVTGKTLLHYAATEGYSTLVTKLLALGATIVVDWDGKIPPDLTNDQNICNLFPQELLNPYAISRMATGARFQPVWTSKTTVPSVYGSSV